MDGHKSGQDVAVGYYRILKDGQASTAEIDSLMPVYSRIRDLFIRTNNSRRANP